MAAAARSLSGRARIDRSPEQVGVNTTQTDHDNRAKELIMGHADHQLYAGLDHRLQGNLRPCLAKRICDGYAR
jgi:hypothetical protein